MPRADPCAAAREERARGLSVLGAAGMAICRGREAPPAFPCPGGPRPTVTTLSLFYLHLPTPCCPSKTRQARSGKARMSQVPNFGHSSHPQSKSLRNALPQNTLQNGTPFGKTAADTTKPESSMPPKLCQLWGRHPSQTLNFPQNEKNVGGGRGGVSSLWTLPLDSQDIQALGLWVTSRGLLRPGPTPAAAGMPAQAREKADGCGRGRSSTEAQQDQCTLPSFPCPQECGV